MEKRCPSVLQSFKQALNKLTGHKRRLYAAELAHAHFDGSPTKMERHLAVNREMVRLGLKELESGIRCVDNYHLRGRKKRRRIRKFDPRYSILN